jgi:hypothetical protein
VLINGKEIFLLKGKNDGNKDATKALYDIYGNNTDNFHDAAVLHQEILIKYNPLESLKIYNHAMLDLKLNAQEIEAYYLHSITKIVDYMYVNEKYFAGIHWAKKGLDLFELFCINAPKAAMPKLKNESIEYQILLSQFEANKEYFDPAFYYPSDESNGVVFHWEADFIPSEFPNNDN